MDEDGHESSRMTRMDHRNRESPTNKGHDSCSDSY